VLVGSTDLDTIFASAPGLTGKTINFFGWHADALTLTCLLLFMGAMGKSAQFLLHTWLPDAMEGPTPVSALIHAATMVTAGVFMVARMSPLFELAPNAQAVVMLVGATTAFFAATIGLVQNDIKRIVAYSTCSQLGYMFVALGVGAYSAPCSTCSRTPSSRRCCSWLRLGDLRDASRAGHPEDGWPVEQDPVHLRDDDHRHAGADRLPVHGRLLLEGRDHRSGLRLAHPVRLLRLPDDCGRGAADLVLFMASGVQDVPWRAARQEALRCST
jgi:hypothetical protein